MVQEQYQNGGPRFSWTQSLEFLKQDIVVGKVKGVSLANFSTAKFRQSQGKVFALSHLTKLTNVKEIKKGVIDLWKFPRGFWTVSVQNFLYQLRGASSTLGRCYKSGIQKRIPISLLVKHAVGWKRHNIFS